MGQIVITKKKLAALAVVLLLAPCFFTAAEDEDLQGQLTDVQTQMEQQQQKKGEAEATIGNVFERLRVIQENLDIMVTPNLYGDIISDLTSGLIGGLGLLPSMNIGTDYAMFEAVHGSAPDIAGMHIANPTALLWSACMMLEYMNENETAATIRHAVDLILSEGTTLTPDLGGTAKTEEYTTAIIAKL